ncbi:A/G-specific adenine glycosylase [Acinetobacter qingfengensis]|uniref:Adenine DNA glycosylase n=1 Tax=Acinetobacter qingfengensis TaxID=1262585 RepID=A0A1E7RD45_9GAMM|nr:A/G-specific adenine glycosylase [Acinetobacter qingfengensis]KAA8732105.1 A/G-specific adenine glycosylase [Acinetobacter qingfengensis]OEY97284.1 A/G-specific adenine glycosylase [Acinetobacter qingfengensis]
MPASQIFASNLLNWFDVHGRHDLPWQIKNDPYKVWVSEIMLQQTQVKTVLQYYARFIQRFPDVKTLAHANWEDVAPYWAGLGYYARARNLHKAAQQVIQLGDFPSTLDGWMALSGIGPSTAGALMSLGLGKFGVILDGNVKRVLSRYFAIAGDLAKPAQEKQLWQLATALVPADRHADYTQAIMDLGATVCTPKKPLCLYCPMQQHCQAYQQGNVLDYPEKKAKKTVPIKTADVLILDYEGQWLWQKRENEGLWGGLYSLPIIEDAQQFVQWQQQWQLESNMQTTIKHQFTHFTWILNCHKFSLQTQDYQALADLFHAEFFSVQKMAHLGIPTAMQKVIQSLQNK